jgi:type I restriction enzyme S subunit
MKTGWQTNKLGDYYDITSSKRVFESEWKSSGVPFYRAREIVKLANQGSVQNELFISDNMYNKYAEKYGVPKEDDIMVTGVGTLGICYVVKKNDKFYFKDGNIIWLKKKSDINSRFVEYAFKSETL